MEQIKCSETSAFNNQTPGKYPKDYTQYSKYGESLKSRVIYLPLSGFELLSSIQNPSQSIYCDIPAPMSYSAWTQIKAQRLCESWICKWRKIKGNTNSNYKHRKLQRPHNIHNPTSCSFKFHFSYIFASMPVFPCGSLASVLPAKFLQAFPRFYPIYCITFPIPSFIPHFVIVI